ncbi:MAG: peroxiredoxin [Bacteroidales bacterium]|nr:peroxiredoxin [Bacteroidales bacterium]
MKTLILTIILISSYSIGFAQNQINTRIPLLGEVAPSFEAESTKGNIKFPEDYFNKWRIILSHPGSFTPVCTSELIEFAEIQEELKRLKTELIVISTDGLNSNLQWIKSMEEMTYRGLNTKKIDFPIISDLGFEISRNYGMQQLQSNSTKNIRGVFIIDPENKIRLISFYPTEIGRNTNEILRALIALQESDKQNVLVPANWVTGEDLMLPPPANQDEFERMKRRQTVSQYYLDWYMWFQRN